MSGTLGVHSTHLMSVVRCALLWKRPIGSATDEMKSSGRYVAKAPDFFMTLWSHVELTWRSAHAPYRIPTDVLHVSPSVVSSIRMADSLTLGTS